MANVKAAAKNFGSWTKNFGLKNAIYMRKRLKRDKKYLTLTDKRRREIAPLVQQIKDQYDWYYDYAVLQEFDIEEYTALEMKLKKITELPDVIYFDEVAADGSKRYKPDFAPETLECQNYIGGGFVRKGKSLSDEKLTFLHVPRLLVRQTKPCQIPGEDDLSAFAARAHADDGFVGPLVSILIPNKDSVDVLSRCIDSIKTKTSYDNYEIVIVENNSEKPETFDYYKTLDARVETLVTGWNYSHIMNEGIKFCKGDYVILLNNDTEVISPDWIEQLLFYCKRKNVGAVGAKLLFPDNTIQHAGVTFGIRGVAGHAFYGQPGGAAGYENRICLPQNVSCVTAAALMVRRSNFDKVGGFDEKLAVNYNDVDFCMKLRNAGLRNVYTPFACLYHHESKTRGNDALDAKKLKQQIKESRYFQKKWCKQILDGDPYYNRNLTTMLDDFSEK